MTTLAVLSEKLGVSGKLLSSFGSGISLVQFGSLKGVLKEHPAARIEAAMLEYLAPHLCVPLVLEKGEGYVLMEYIESSGRLDEAHVARALANLHANKSDRFGLSFDTTIGPHRQPNTPTHSWTEFYKDMRLLHMGRACLDAGRIDSSMMGRIERVADRLETLLPQPVPSLLHGDIWSGNVIIRESSACFIDPAVYYGHNEVELAFILMFDTFGSRFFDAYGDYFPIEKGFFEERQFLYQLYPVLVHVRSFGSGYIGMLEGILRRFD